MATITLLIIKGFLLSCNSSQRGGVQYKAEQVLFRPFVVLCVCTNIGQSEHLVFTKFNRCVFYITQFKNIVLSISVKVGQLARVLLALPSLAHFIL